MSVWSLYGECVEIRRDDLSAADANSRPEEAQSIRERLLNYALLTHCRFKIYLILERKLSKSVGRRQSQEVGWGSRDGDTSRMGLEMFDSRRQLHVSFYCDTHLHWPGSFCSFYIYDSFLFNTYFLLMPLLFINVIVDGNMSMS